jgi:hypothetical protein
MPSKKRNLLLLCRFSQSSHGMVVIVGILYHENLHFITKMVSFSASAALTFDEIGPTSHSYPFKNGTLDLV